MTNSKGGMGAMAPMGTGRQPSGWSRRGRKLWPVKAGPARPGQQKTGMRGPMQVGLHGPKARGGRSWNA